MSGICRGSKALDCFLAMKCGGLGLCTKTHQQFLMLQVLPSSQSPNQLQASHLLPAGCAHQSATMDVHPSTPLRRYGFRCGSGRSKQPQERCPAAGGAKPEDQRTCRGGVFPRTCPRCKVVAPRQVDAMDIPLKID